jgi:hypothetical protein
MISTFVFVTFAWIFFRAEGLGQALAYVKQIVISAIQFPNQFFHKTIGFSIFYYIIPLLLGDWWLRRDERNLKVKFPTLIRIPLFIIFALIILYKFNSNSKFIYFQF